MGATVHRAWPQGVARGTLVARVRLVRCPQLSPSCDLKELSPCLSLRPEPGKLPVPGGGSGSSPGSEAFSGSSETQVLPLLQPRPTLHTAAPSQLSRAFLFLEYTSSHPRQGLALWLAPSGILFPKAFIWCELPGPVCLAYNVTFSDKPSPPWQRTTLLHCPGP